jgi:Septum formation initiator.
MQEIKTNKYKGSWVLRVTILCFAVFIIFTVVNQRSQISEKKAELEQINEKVRVQEIKNDELQYILDNESDLEQKAEESARRDYNYAKPEERVFINAGGTD